MHHPVVCCISHEKLLAQQMRGIRWMQQNPDLCRTHFVGPSKLPGLGKEVGKAAKSFQEAAKVIHMKFVSLHCKRFNI